MSRILQLGPLPATLLAVSMGMLFSVALYPVWDLEGRWFYIIIIAIVLVAVSLMFIGRFADFLLVSLFFSIPVASFTKWLMIDGYVKKVADAVPHSGGLSIGITEILIVTLYFTWFLRIFVTRTEKIPELVKMDLWVTLVVLAYLISIPGTTDVALGLFATEYLVVHVLLYYYLSRNLRWRHIPWLLGSVLFAILLEGAIGIGQHSFGLAPGLALDKGALGEDLTYQYEVPGLEATRATGSVYDSHTLGLYVTMLVTYVFILLYAPFTSTRMRVVAATLIAIGLGTILISYSRSAWLSCAIAIFFAITVLLFKWKERSILPSILIVTFLILPFLPWILDILVERFANAPGKIMSVRYEMLEVGYEIWRTHPIFGFGVGNYMLALDQFNVGFSEELPVHNMMLWIAAETGIFGVFAFSAVIVSTFRRLWKLIQDQQNPVSHIALAAILGLTAYMIDGLTNPLYRDPVVYKYFWLSVALSVALPVIREELDKRKSVNMS